MTERPILFSGPMVRALPDGRKTQTRRIVKLDVPEDADEVFFWSAEGLRAAGCTNVAEPGLWARRHGRDGYLRYIGKCPYGVPGDSLWVKETWADVNLQGAPAIAYRADSHLRDLMDEPDWLDDRGAFNYDDPRMAFGKTGLRFAMWSEDLLSGVQGHHWRSPLHMPRWASRRTLAVVDIRVQRLAEISREDAIAEGASARLDPHGLGPAYDRWSMDWSRVGLPGFDGQPLTEKSISLGTPQLAFANFINELHGGPRWNFYYNGDGRYPEPIFDANPWVWAVTFEVRA